MNNIIKVSFCVAYDWYLLRNALPAIYGDADIICLSVDINRVSWTGASFKWDEQGFRDMIRELDPEKKISILEADFYNPELSPMQNEVAQRNRIAAHLGLDGWHIQLDADEYFINFKGFVNYLKSFRSKRKVNICCPLINIYKQIPEGALWIKPNHFKQIEYIQIATQFPKYEYGRRNSYFNILTDFSILHQSWARSEGEIWEKLNNWGHAKDFDVEKYFKIWKQAGIENYTSYHNFHHLHPEIWPSLILKRMEPGTSLLKNNKKEDFPLPITKLDLLKSNSIWFSRLKKALNVLIKG